MKELYNTIIIELISTCGSSRVPTHLNMKFSTMPIYSGHLKYGELKTSLPNDNIFFDIINWAIHDDTLVYTEFYNGFRMKSDQRKEYPDNIEEIIRLFISFNEGPSDTIDLNFYYLNHNDTQDKNNNENNSQNEYIDEKGRSYIKIEPSHEIQFESYPELILTIIHDAVNNRKYEFKPGDLIYDNVIGTNKIPNLLFDYQLVNSIINEKTLDLAILASNSNFRFLKRYFKIKDPALYELLLFTKFDNLSSFILQFNEDLNKISILKYIDHVKNIMGRKYLKDIYDEYSAVKNNYFIRYFGVNNNSSKVWNNVDNLQLIMNELEQVLEEKT